ncbi:MAG: alpha/beta hydrolase [Chloroflexota bacterium]|nr:alpha/beta hydrolase [Chloroflexota bacterium]
MTSVPLARRALLDAVAVTVLLASIGLGGLDTQTTSARSVHASPRPTVVLVHGSWYQPSSWTAVAARLRDHGYRVIVPDNPLRTLAGDAASIAGVLRRVKGPIVLGGHSYGGAVITNAAQGNPNVKALVYVAAFAPDRGESAIGLDSRDPGSLVPLSTIAVPFVQSDGNIGLDLYINPLLYRSVLAHDVPARMAAALAAGQRPVTLAAGMEPSSTPAWRTIPSWYMVTRNDRSLPPATQRFMAERAGATTVEIDSSHSVSVSHPDAVTNLILAAARTAGRRSGPLRAAGLVLLDPPSGDAPQGLANE